MKLSAEIVNHGYLPTYISSQRRQMKLAEPIRVELSGAEIIQGQAQSEIEALEGYALDQTELSFSSVYGQTAAMRKQLEWIIRAPVPTTVELQVMCAQAGQIRAVCTIE